MELQGENATTPGLLPQHQFCHLCQHNEGVLHFHIANAVFPKAPPDSLPIDTPSAVRRNKPWDPGIVFGRHRLKNQHLEDKVFLIGQGVIGKRDSIADKGMYSEEIDTNQNIATTGVSIANKGANQAEKEVQAVVNTKRKISKPAYLKDYV